MVFGHRQAEEIHEFLKSGEGSLAELVVQDEVEPGGRKERSGIKTHIIVDVNSSLINTFLKKRLAYHVQSLMK